MKSLSSCIVLLYLSIGCTPPLKLNQLVFNGVHCSKNNEKTCNLSIPKENRLCTPCDQTYDWSEYGISSDQVESLEIINQDGTTNDAYIIRSDIDAPTIIYSHGNWGSIEHFRIRMQYLVSAGFNVVIYEYRGFGKSSSVDYPEKNEFYQDIATAHTSILSALNLNSSQVLYYGYSLGGLAAGYASTISPPCATILEAPFPSLEILTELSTKSSLPYSFITSDDYNNKTHMRHLSSPLLILHGTEDALIPIQSSWELYSAASSSKEFIVVELASHGVDEFDIPNTLGEEYSSVLHSFAESNGCT